VLHLVTAGVGGCTGGGVAEDLVLSEDCFGEELLLLLGVSGGEGGTAEEELLCGAVGSGLRFNCWGWRVDSAGVQVGTTLDILRGMQG
jgi:hypothetical protein